MSVPDLDWESLRFFAVMRRHKSFSAAARELGVDATTASRRLAQLERQLGARLFQRTRDGLVPTDAAEAVAEPLARIEQQIERVRSAAAGRDARAEGIVRVAVTEAFAETSLVPQLGALRERHPGLEVHLLVADRFADLARGEADLAVRFRAAGQGPPADPRSTDVVARKLATVSFGVYAARAYVARRGKPRSTNDVDAHDLVLPRSGAAFLPGSPWFAAVEGRGRAALRVDAVGAMVAAVRAGLGLGVVSNFLARADAELVHVRSPADVDARDVWLLAPADLVRTARVRAVWDWFVALARSWRG